MSTQWNAAVHKQRQTTKVQDGVDEAHKHEAE